MSGPYVCRKCGYTQVEKPMTLEPCRVCLKCDWREFGKSAETDPNGIDQHAPGAKLDKGKPMAGLIQDFGLALLEVARVGTFGASKYTRGGWQHVENGQERYRDAGWRHGLKRHIEDADPDSGLHHLAHEAWNKLAELELMLRGEK